MILHAFKPLTKKTLRGFATVELANGLIIEDMTAHTKNGKSWVGMPSKPLLENGGVKMANGKPVYVSILRWTNRERGDRFSDEVIKLILAEHPSALA